jgi:hypothetical protein
MVGLIALFGAFLQARLPLGSACELLIPFLPLLGFWTLGGRWTRQGRQWRWTFTLLMLLLYLMTAACALLWRMPIGDTVCGMSLLSTIAIFPLLDIPDAMGAITELSPS